MSKRNFTTPKTNQNFNTLGGGLNTTSGPLNLAENESSGLQNIDFDIFGSIFKRNGYAALNTSAISGTPQIDGLYWYEYDYPFVREAVTVAGGSMYKMDGLDGTWDNVTINTDMSKQPVTKSVTGLDDLTFDGTFSGSTNIEYKVVIDLGNTSAKETGSITVFADATGGQVTVTSTDHQLINGDTVVITGTTNYNGTFVVANVQSTTFEITDTWVANDATGTWTVLNTFEWFKDDVSQASGVAITAASQSLDNGVTIEFANKSGHTLDDSWLINTGLDITAGELCDFETFLNSCLVTNNEDPPFRYDGSNSSEMSVPLNLTKAKFIAQFQNYCLLANVEVNGTRHESRFYWSTIKSIDEWNAADFIDISPQDGQEITGFKVLSDRLIVYKTRSVYIVLFTGDRNLPFIVSKTNSYVGCIAPYSIQEANNGHIFLAYDGLYFFDGNSSYKISDKINSLFEDLNEVRFSEVVSLVQNTKNRYMISLSTPGSGSNDLIITWDWVLNAFSKYSGVNASAMTRILVSGNEERIYFGDYGGFTYRMDTGVDDYPANVQTAIDAYYYTNWKNFDDLSYQKAIPHISIYHQIANTVLTLSYSYDFDDDDTYSLSIDLSTSGALYGTAIYGTDVWGKSGGEVQRKDLTGRGRTVRFKLSNSSLSETFQVDGFGVEGYIETNL